MLQLILETPDDQPDTNI